MATIETGQEDRGAESCCSIDEGFVCSCDFTYPWRQARPRNLSETISAAYRLDWRSLRVLYAETEFTFTRYQNEPRRLLEDITWRSDPRTWTRTSLPPLPATAARFGFAFCLPADRDDNVVSLDGEEPRSFYDPASRRLRLDFAPLGRPYEIYPLSAGAAIFVGAEGEGADGKLLALAFDGFEGVDGASGPP